jgi:hypothetical protein
METPTESDEGYPEEQPDQVDSDERGAPQERKPREAGKGRDAAEDSGPGKATGNPRSAG